jgi:hypothetical protein
MAAIKIRVSVIFIGGAGRRDMHDLVQKRRFQSWILLHGGLARFDSAASRVDA